MPDVALFDVAGVRPEKPNKYNSLATLKWIGGLQTQRSPFMSIDTRYNSRYLGGKPDALIAGSNIELNNKLMLQRRPGLLPYGPSIPSPDFFFSWQQSTLSNFVATVDPTFSIYPSGNLQLITDTATNGTTAPGNIYNYSPTYAGIIVEKSPLSQQTSFQTVINTMYMGDGVDLLKMTGANLLTQSNVFNVAPWSSVGVTSFTSGQLDPTGASNATGVLFSTTGSSTSSYILQHVTPNYMPVGGNTFTFSIWMKASSGSPTIFLQMTDSTGAVMVNTQQTLTTSWALYQVTGVAASAATFVTVILNDPSSSVITYNLYGAQLEAGGPATPTAITTNKPLGVWLWGIEAPSAAPTFTLSSQSGSTGAPWTPDHAYSQTTFALTSVAATSGGSAVYTSSGTFTSAVVGRYFSVTGFTNSSNNSTAPGFVASAFTTHTITLNNLSAVAESHAAVLTELDTIVDSNGNLEVAYTPGTSGGSQPVWNPVQGGSTSDGLQNVIVQSIGQQFSATGGAVTLATNVTAGNTVLAFVAFLGSGTSTTVSSSVDGSLTKLKQFTSRQLNLSCFYFLSSAGGASTFTFASAGNPTWIGVAEVEPMSASDGTPGSNIVADSSSALFLTGAITTTNVPDLLISFATFLNASSGFEIGNTPVGYQNIIGQQQTAIPQGNFWNNTVAFEVPAAAGTFNPTWTVTNPNSGFNDAIGITVGFKSTVGTLVWYNVGQTAQTGLTPKTGYTYYYAFVNTYTGQRSDVSPLSASTGAQTGVAVNVTGTGMQTVPGPVVQTFDANGYSSSYDEDPQVDAIEVYRNTDGGGFWYQIPPSLMTNTSGLYTAPNGTVYLKNPGTATSPGTWFFTDTVLDTQLNTQIFAPIAFLNARPPVGLKNLEFFDGRLWGSVNNFLYYATAADDATLINVLENGVSAESWEPTNYIPFNSAIVRSVATGNGLVIFTTTDVWVIQGTNLAQYNPVKVLTGVGLGTYNGLCIDGSNIMLYTRDRECLMFNLNAGAAEIGFLIGDLIESNINPLFCYLARHVKGSQDNAFYFGDGSTGWFRLNPNQYGASASGEQTPIWSPFATIASAGGAGALASIEVQPGIKQLLVGRTGTGTGPVLNRDISTFSDNGTTYTWSATIGSIMLALPGKLAEIESITTEMYVGASSPISVQCGVAVLIDEIAGTFSPLGGTQTNPTNDPPQLAASVSVLSNRFYLSTITVPPIGRHMQIQLTGAAGTTQDVLMALTVRGALIEEQS